MSVGLQGGIICFGWEGDEQLDMMSREDIYLYPSRLKVFGLIWDIL